MKFSILAILCLQGTTSAFMPAAPRSQHHRTPSALNVISQGVRSDLPPFPLDEPFKRVQGGKTVVTWPMPLDAERVEMMFRSSGRPMKVTGESPKVNAVMRDTRRLSRRRRIVRTVNIT